MSVASSVTIDGFALGSRPAVEVGTDAYPRGFASVCFQGEHGTAIMSIRVEAWRDGEPDDVGDPQREGEVIVRIAVGGITPDDAAHMGRALLAFAKSGGAQ